MKTFRKTFRINAEPSDVYAALTNPYTIELWSGYPAEMSTAEGWRKYYMGAINSFFNPNF